MPTPDPSTSEFEHLRGLAEAATPGPWEVPESIHGDPYINEVGKGLLSGGNIALANTRDDYGKSNAAYIAAVNPAVVLALLDRLAAVEALAEGWETRAGEGSAAWRAFGPQDVSVPFAVKSIREALGISTPPGQQIGGDPS